jgi:hypothetical protein
MGVRSDSLDYGLQPSSSKHLTSGGEKGEDGGTEKTS